MAEHNENETPEVWPEITKRGTPRMDPAEFHEKHPQLRPFSEMSKEERTELARKGCIKRNENAKRKKKLGELMDAILISDVPDAKARKLLADLGYDVSRKSYIALQTIAKAETGDIEAARFVRDTIGEKPVEGMVVGTLDPADIANMDLSQLSDAELLAMLQREEEAEQDE